MSSNHSDWQSRKKKKKKLYSSTSPPESKEKKNKTKQKNIKHFLQSVPLMLRYGGKLENWMHYAGISNIHTASTELMSVTVGKSSVNCNKEDESTSTTAE